MQLPYSLVGQAVETIFNTISQVVETRVDSLSASCKAASSERTIIIMEVLGLHMCSTYMRESLEWKSEVGNRYSGSRKWKVEVGSGSQKYTMAQRGLPFPFQNSIVDFHFRSGFPTSILAEHTSILELHVFILRMRV